MMPWRQTSWSAKVGGKNCHVQQLACYRCILKGRSWKCTGKCLKNNVLVVALVWVSIQDKFYILETFENCKKNAIQNLALSITKHISNHKFREFNPRTRNNWGKRLPAKKVVPRRQMKNNRPKVCVYAKIKYPRHRWLASSQENRSLFFEANPIVVWLPFESECGSFLVRGKLF